ncbi:MAG: DNA (cytosine-5-)-methyltransferase [Clostridiales bacterium]|nr:DNA (cytosine-5-)-methyltransferase [Clostridiales bacterium]
MVAFFSGRRYNVNIRRDKIPARRECIVKIRLATAFSGIGAIEQAFKRMNVDHEIVFACDNGDIDIDVNTDDELKKIKRMQTVEEKREYVRQLYREKSRRQNFVEISYLDNYCVDDDNYFYDVKMLDGTDFFNKVDWFVGGSPCQSFSIAGARGGFEDTRGTLFYEYVRLVKEINPQVFIYENVYGVLTHDKGRTWATMQNVFSELGYHIKWQILDSRNYGIPQGRRRLFVVGFKDVEAYQRFKFPEPIDLKFTMQDFLLDNCADGNFNYDANGNIVLTSGGQVVERYLSQKLIDYVMSPGTKNFYHENAEIDLPIARAILSTQGNSHRSSVNNYVTTNGRIRALEPRESLRLMGFPDSFKITVSRAQSYKQSGNSIVVDVLMAISKQILAAIGE